MATSSNAGDVLYSFRRCPYAMRARMALAVSGTNPFVREVVLRNKPEEMLAAGTRGTVPLLVFADGRVLEESLDVMDWALAQADPRGWLRDRSDPALEELLATNDERFKWSVDRYKYPDRYPAGESAGAREGALHALSGLESTLASRPFIAGNAPGFFDAAMFPFVRQFAAVEPQWFTSNAQPGLVAWRNRMLAAPLFTQVMKKLPAWSPGDTPLPFADTLV